jgi:hypothetical protein
LFAGWEAKMLLALAVAELAGVVGAGAFAVGIAIRDIATSAFAERRELAALVGFDAKAEGAFPKALGEDLGTFAVFFGLFGGEPAGGGQVIGAGGARFAEALALSLVEELVVAPCGAGTELIGRPGKAGAEEGAVGRGEKIGGGLGAFWQA